MYMRPAGIWAMEMTAPPGAVAMAGTEAPGNVKDSDPIASGSGH
jgi:hypothetical protein